MLAVAIATTVSRALSYGTIYTTKLLRRGTDIDRAAPWRAVADLKITDVMHPFRPALPVPPGATTDPAHQGGAGKWPDGAAFACLVAERHDLQTLFSSESLGPALRQLAVYGRDGLPVVSPDERQLEGWVTSEGVLRALARRVAGTTADETAHAQATADGEPDDPRAMLEHPSVPLPGYYVAEITITGNSPAAGRKLGDVSWPHASTPVLVLRGGSLRQPHPDTVLDPGDRVSLLIPAARDTESSDAELRNAELPG
jgi:chloride channel protein, CIC family